MINVISYHTSDNGPTVLDQHHTVVEARQSLKEYARQRKAVKVSDDRYEFKGKGFAIALYLEDDTTVLYHVEGLSGAEWKRLEQPYITLQAATKTAAMWRNAGAKARVVKVTTEIIG